MVLDRHGDVLLAVTADAVDGTGNAFGVAKLAGATGDMRWISRESIDSRHWQAAMRVVVDDAGAVFAAGMTNDGTGEPSSNEGDVFTVVRLDPETGVPMWRYRAGGAGNAGFARTLAVGPDGAVVAAGYASTAETCSDAFVVALDGAGGEPRWSRTVDGSFSTGTCRPRCSLRSCPLVDDDQFTALAIDHGGDVIVAGSRLDRRQRRARSVSFLQRVSVGRSRRLLDPTEATWSAIV
jgi:outer membrane protein assembly factor BamB